MDIKPTQIFVIALVTLAASLGGCTLDDGQPWGWLEGALTVPEPGVAEAFAVDSYEVEVEGIRLLRETESAEASGSEGCHGDHCHGTQPADSAREPEAELVHIALGKVLGGPAPFDFGEVAIAEQAHVAAAVVEVHAVIVHGQLSRGGQITPATIHLEDAHLEWSGPAHLAFGADAPEHQELAIEVRWPEDWLAEVHLDELQSNSRGEVVIGNGSNVEAAGHVVEALGATELHTTIESDSDSH